MSQLYCVLVTCRTVEDAKSLGRLAVENRLAACAQVQEKVTSLYTWNGQIQEDIESLLRLKTVEAKLPELERLLRSHHSYDCPQIVGFPLPYSTSDYERWVIENTIP